MNKQGRAELDRANWSAQTMLSAHNLYLAAVLILFLCAALSL